MNDKQYVKRIVTLILEDSVPVAMYMGNGKITHYSLKEMGEKELDELNGAGNVEQHGNA